MQKELSLIKEWIKKNKVIDVIMFGSSVRGKSKPGDVDLCILIKDEGRSLDLVDSLGKLTDKFKQKFQINVLDVDSYFKGNTLAKTILQEGFSVRFSKNFASAFGFESKSLFVYSLKGFNASKRVQLHYVLKGRYGSKGILKEIDGSLIGSGSILVPTTKEDVLREVFDHWSVKYKVFRMLM